jgi:hypothetical protein
MFCFQVGAVSDEESADARADAKLNALAGVVMGDLPTEHWGFTSVPVKMLQLNGEMRTGRIGGKIGSII